MPKRTSRRNFIKTGAAVGVGFWAAGGVTPKPSLAASEELRLACIGIGGKGGSDSDDAVRRGQVVAICDVDEGRIGAWQDKYDLDNRPKEYYDYRKLLDEMHGKIDAVTVSTPDHNHAPASVMAMRLGKHCFCQKPMTHSIHEARVMGELAREKGLVTQMGNQGTAEFSLRESAALIKAGAIGKIESCHIWTNRPVWPQGLDRPTDKVKVPKGIHWNEWVGPAPMRDYHDGLHPFKWRGWWDFGTGALGDMACHTLNMSFMALNLRDPLSVQAETDGHNKETYPKWSQIRFEFPAKGDRGAIPMTWYDGGKRPDAKYIPTSEDLKAFIPKRDKEKYANEEAWLKFYNRLMTSGAVVVGDKGYLYSAGDYGGDRTYTCLKLGKEWVQQAKVEMPAVDVPRPKNHFTEWTDAIKNGGQATSNFPDYAGPLTETILLGNLAVWAASSPGKGPRIDWDAKSLTVKNGTEDLKEIVKHTYHNGYEL